MANGDVIHITSWDAASTGYLEWYESVTTGGTFSNDSGQSVPDGSAYALKALHNTTGDLLLEYSLDTAATTYTTGCVSFWFKGTTNLTAGSNEDILNIYRSANSARNARIYFDTAGALRVAFWSTNQVSSNLTTIDSGWHYIQLAWDYSTTTNKLKLAVDGVQFAEQTYTAAAAPALDYINLGNQVASGDSATSTKYYGPVVFTAGYYIPPQFKVKMLRPNGDVDTTWTCSTGTSRYQLVDDVPPDTGTYIGSATSAQSQRLDMTDVTLGTSESIKAVQATATSAAGIGVTPTCTFYITDSGGTDLTAISSLGDTTGGVVYAGAALLTKPGGGSWTSTVVNGARTRLLKASNTDTCRVAEIYWKVAIATPWTQTHTGTLSFTSAQTKKAKATDTATLSFTSAQTRRSFSRVAKVLTAALSFTSAQTRGFKARFTATLSFTGSTAGNMWRQLQDAGGWFIKKGRIRRRRPY